MEATANSNAAAARASVETLDHVLKNHNHPLHLHPSDTPGGVLTSVQLTGTENYSLWSRLMLITLRAKSKLGFVLGTCKKSDYKSELEEQWKKCNAFVLAWIMNTVSKELLSGIVYASDAAMVWADLKERFDKVDGSRSYQLHREICTLHQGSMTVSAYFTKMRLLWDEFDALVPPPACNCDKSRMYVDHIQYLRLFAFLMGLNEVYGHARSQILMMNPLPNVSRAYAMVVADESQCVTAGSKVSGEMNAMYAGGTGKGTYHTSGGNNTGQLSNNYRQRRNWNVICNHCKMHVHTRDGCYKLVGYPNDWKFKKRPGMQQNNRAQRNGDAVNHVTATKDELEQLDEFAPVAPMVKGKDIEPHIQPTFTQSQYNRILHMLEKEDASSSSGKGLDNMANMAGPLKWKGEGDW